MTTWTHLLGLPIGQAEALLHGASHLVVETRAPRRDNAPVQERTEGTLRVIRVREVGGALELTVSRFPDGDPKHI